MLLRIEGVERCIGDRVLFAGVDLVVRAGDRVGLVGRNGAGKTTLVRIAAELEAPDAGRVTRPRDVRVALLRQEIDPSREHSVREEASTVFAHLDALEIEMRELEAQISRAGAEGTDVPEALASRYDACRTAFESDGGFECEARVERMLEGLGFDAERRDRPLSSFSGGWLMRVELAKLLLAAPDVLLLDEPTNHLDLPSIRWFEETLSTFRGGVVIISHDRVFLRRHATRIAELEFGSLTVTEGGYDRYLEEKRARREQLLARKRNQDRQIAETSRFVERFRYKASKARQVQSRIKALDRIERVEVGEERRAGMRLRIPEPARAGETVLRLEGVHKSYGDNHVYRGVDLRIRRGERVAFVGPNGAGKSTLLRIAAGVLPFDEGERTPGHNVTVGFFAQHQLESLEPTDRVLASLERVAGIRDHPRLRSHLGAFLFPGEDVEKRVEVLSGGEKARLALARMLLRPANFLVLDEPTNHLDLEACEVLETALHAYAGTLLFISHDRAFIDVLATRIVEVCAGELLDFPGSYSDYEHALEARAQPREEGSAAGAPVTKRERIAARERGRDQRRRLERGRKRVTALEQEITAFESDLEALGWRLGDPEIHRNGDAVRALEAERETLRSALAERYRDWERGAAEVEVLESEDE